MIAPPSIPRVMTYNIALAEPSVDTTPRRSADACLQHGALVGGAVRSVFLQGKCVDASSPSKVRAKSLSTDRLWKPKTRMGLAPS